MKKINVKILTLLILINFFTPLKLVRALETGTVLFKNNCSVCHLGGNNIIIPEKNLKNETLEANGMNSKSAISYQITNGKNGMPAFGGRLKEIEIEKIAEYVLDQAANNFEN
jgi:cytochrome c6